MGSHIDFIINTLNGTAFWEVPLQGGQTILSVLRKHSRQSSNSFDAFQKFRHEKMPAPLKVLILHKMMFIIKLLNISVLIKAL